MDSRSSNTNKNDIDWFLSSPLTVNTSSANSLEGVPYTSRFIDRPQTPLQVSEPFSPSNVSQSSCSDHDGHCFGKGKPVEQGTPFLLPSPPDPVTNMRTVRVNVHQLISAIEVSMSFPFHPAAKEHLNLYFKRYFSKNLTSSSETRHEINGESNGRFIEKWKEDVKRRTVNKAISWIMDKAEYEDERQLVTQLDILPPKSKVILVAVSEDMGDSNSSIVPSRLGVVHGTYRIPDKFYSLVEEEVDSKCSKQRAHSVSFSFEAEAPLEDHICPYFGHVALWKPRKHLYSLESLESIMDNTVTERQNSYRHSYLCEPLPITSLETDCDLRSPTTASWRRILGVRCKYCRCVVASSESSHHLKRYHPQHILNAKKESSSTTFKNVQYTEPSSSPVQDDFRLRNQTSNLSSKPGFPLCRCAYCSSMQKDTSAPLTGSFVVVGIRGDSELFYSLKIERKLGQGAQGDVWLMSSVTSRCSATGSNIFAVKCIAVSELPNDDVAAPKTSGRLVKQSSESIYKRLERRADALFSQACMCAQLKNDHIIDYLCVVKGYMQGSCSSQSSTTRVGHPIVIIVMPYYPEGDLAQFIRKTSPSDLNHILISSFILQIASALRYMHGGNNGLIVTPTEMNDTNNILHARTSISENNPIIHGDIKPENILLKNNKTQVVLMDLDTVRRIRKHNDKNVPEVITGTFEWMAPECHNQDISSSISSNRAHNNKEAHHPLAVLPNNPASDIWSLGQLLFVLLTLPEYVDLPCPVADPPDTPCILSSSTWWNHKLCRPSSQREVINLFASLNSHVLEHISSVGINSTFKTDIANGAVSGRFGGGDRPNNTFATVLPNESELYDDRDWPLLDVLRMKMSSCGCPARLQLLVLRMMRADYRKRPSAGVVIEELQEVMENFLLGEKTEF